MQYSLRDKEGKVKNYEISYSQVLQQKTNKLLTTLIILLVTLLLIVIYTLIKIDAMNIPTKLIYGY